MHRAFAVSVGLALSSCVDVRAPTVETIVLPASPVGKVFEPTLAIDPDNPQHMVVAAMRGILPAAE